MKSKKSFRSLAVLAATLGIIASIFVSSTPASAADANLTVTVYGDRSSDGSLPGQSGATVTVYSDSGLTTSIGSCVTNSSGQCSVSVSGLGFRLRQFM